MALALGTSATDLRVGSSSISRMAKGSTAFWDADAADYVSRVQAADGEDLELGVVAAYHAFCLGCKDDGIWGAIQACCVMAGARTVAGALVPLKRPYGPELVDIDALPTPTIANLGGSDGHWSSESNTFGNGTSGTDSGYPRFGFAISGMTVGRRYRVSGRLTGDITRVSNIRLATSGSANTVAYNSSTGIFEGIAESAIASLEFVTDGRYVTSVTIESLSIREDSFTPTAYPQPVNFVSGDYSRSLGLKGDGSTKYIDTNRANNAEGQDDVHIAAYLTASASNASYVIGANAGGSNNTLAGYDFWCRSLTGQGPSDAPGAGLNAVSRSSSASFAYVDAGGAPQTSAKASATQSTINNVFVFAYNSAGSPSNITNARLSYYSIGASLDLSILDTRVSALMTQIAAALA